MTRRALVIVVVLTTPLLLAGVPGGEPSEVLPSVLGSRPDLDPETVDTSPWPKKYQDEYKVFAARCSKCHPLSRSVNGKATPDFWRNYVMKMSRRSGSGINPSNGAVLVDFLIFYTELMNGTWDGGTP